ncbi:MAG: hypothetical protein Fur0022_08100 [Anaerolineales bacterium]
MQHKTFEAWIFEEEELDAQEEKVLHQHLQQCDQCYALKKNWPKVETLLFTVPPVLPAPGFTTRWQARLERERKQRERRQTFTLLAISTGGASVAFILFSIALLLHLQLFPQNFLEAITRLTEWALFLDVAGKIFIDLARTLPAAIPFPWWMGFFALTGAGGVLWLKSFRKLQGIFAPGFTRWA